MSLVASKNYIRLNLI